MSLFDLSLPSIGRVLEAHHGFIPRIPSAVRPDHSDASISITAALALVPDSQTPNAPSSLLDLMKTVDFRYTVEEDEQVSLKVSNEPASGGPESGSQAQVSGNWIKHHFSLFVTAVRKLLPTKTARASLRTAA